MIDFIKRFIFWFWNPGKNPSRDKTGKIIDDWARRKHSKEVMQKLESGKAHRPGFHGTTVPYSKTDGPRNFEINTVSKITTVKVRD